MENCVDGQYLLDFGEPLIYIKPTSEWTPEERSAVKSIQFSKKEGIKVEMSDKLGALRLLSDIAGLSKQSVEISGAGGQPIALNLIFQDDEEGKEGKEGEEINKDEDPGHPNAVPSSERVEDQDP
jgi:hypothetical protein